MNGESSLGDSLENMWCADVSTNTVQHSAVRRSVNIPSSPLFSWDHSTAEIDTY